MRNRQKASTVWIFGLSGAGKTTFARELISNMRGPVLHLDGDELREGVCEDLGFSQSDRMANITRAAHIAKLANDQGIPCVVSMITPNYIMREKAKSIIGESQFKLVYMSTPLEACMERDAKGLYAKKVSNMTGTEQEFEGLAKDEVPALIFNTTNVSLSDMHTLATWFARKGCL